MAADDDLPLSIRRPRRSNFGIRTQPYEDYTPPRIPHTPKRRKSRHSDFGASSSSGLTPMIRMTQLMTPTSRSRSRHRASKSPTPLIAPCSRPVYKPIPFQVQKGSVVDGRVERRLRRTALKTQLEKLDAAHHRASQQTKSQIANLKAQLIARDREINDLKNATIIIDTERVHDLEQQVENLQGELKKKEQESTLIGWTVAARDPFRESDQMDIGQDDDDETIANTCEDYDDVFGDTTIDQLQHSTPPRVRSSFPTPPATSPSGPVPETPLIVQSQARLEFPPAPISAHAGMQACIPDLEKQKELESLKDEANKITAMLDANELTMERLSQRLPKVPSIQDESTMQTLSNIEIVEQQVDTALQVLSDRGAALADLTSAICSLGFTGEDALEMLNSMAQWLRTARLELEYITPGEIPIPLTSHGAETLNLVLKQLRNLSNRVKNADSAIDEYHATELNLRQQLDERVNVTDELRADLDKAKCSLDEREARNSELTVANNRLKGALDSYIRDISEMENLIQRLESEASEQKDTISQRDASISDLEACLSAAEQRATDLQDEIEVSHASRMKQLDCVNQRSAEALAWRDARVTELREEVHRISASLIEAQDTICTLRANNGRVTNDNSKLRVVVGSMRTELLRVAKMSEELLVCDNTDSTEMGVWCGDRKSGLLAQGEDIRRGSNKRRRGDSGCDSGLVLVEADETGA